MRQKKSLVILLALVVFGLIALGTAGIAVYSGAEFSGDKIELLKGLGPNVWISSTMHGFSIPFVFDYTRNDRPFELRVQIRTETKQYTSITLTETLIEYSDGGMVRIDEPWTQTFQAYTQYNSASGKLIKMEKFKLSDNFVCIIPEHRNFKVTLTGFLEKPTGEKVPFSANGSFDAKSEFYIGTVRQKMGAI